MKISTLAADQGGSPGSNLIGQTGQSVSKDRVEAAKAAFLGETSPGRLAPSDTPIDPQVERAQNSIRKIKMATNVSPERYLQQVEAAQADPLATLEAERAISDTPEQVNATAEDTKPISPQFAALAKQRRALQVKERELADRERALETRHSNDGGQDLVARIKSEPLSVLREHGVTYDQLTQAVLADQSNPEIQALKMELKALKEGVDKTLTDRDTQQEQAALSQMRLEASELAKEGDAFEMVRETRSVPKVIELIYRTYKSTGEVLDVQEAMQLVEDDLLDQNLKLANIGKLKSKLLPAQEVQPQVQSQPQMRTLTNRDTARQPLDRKARAMAAFHKK